METIIPNSKLKKFITENKKEINNKNIALTINEIINEGIRLNMNQFEIITFLNSEFKENKKMIKNLIKKRFNVSKLKTIKKLNETNKNIIFSNTIEFLENLIKDKNIKLDNILDNLYELVGEAIEFITKYKITDNEKNKLIIQVLLNIIEDIITDLSLVDKENLKLINNIKQIIEDTLPSYIQCIIEADLNEEAIVQTQKYCIKLLLSCLFKSS